MFFSGHAFSSIALGDFFPPERYYYNANFDIDTYMYKFLTFVVVLTMVIFKGLCSLSCRQTKDYKSCEEDKLFVSGVRVLIASGVVLGCSLACQSALFI